MPKRFNRTGWLALAGVMLVILLALLAARGLRGRVNRASEDGLQNIASEKGQFTLSVEPSIQPIPMNQIHAWKLRLADAAGNPLENAVISVDGGMPAHGHGLPTRPQVTGALGNGQYLLEGLRFQMPGEWVVNVHVSADRVDDTATVRFMLR